MQSRITGNMGLSLETELQEAKARSGQSQETTRDQLLDVVREVM